MLFAEMGQEIADKEKTKKKLTTAVLRSRFGEKNPSVSKEFVLPVFRFTYIRDIETKEEK